ncbi:hypothetical protein JAAARDRAFT_33025 [Jaapia argillacea MUCL 33604]|uniref:Protein CMS1 n=1 Tax=Jaapia argillacea MUCL 33604 TaxID=933084 RepID=A0A067PXP8_9AGAM|nr:hypothetical protein JAAARDRAFT_33025 [Jaapia argillacea MUCL 33604]
MSGKADDLQDDFVPDETIVLSEEEDVSDDGPESMSGGDQDQEGESSHKVQSSDDKEKKRKRREKEKERKAKKRRMAETLEPAQPMSIAFQPPTQLAEYLSSMQAKTFSKMSSIELVDMQIPESSIADTTIWTGPRTLDELVDFIPKVLPALKVSMAQRPKLNGTPCLIFVAGAALRVADVTRVLKTKKLRGEKGGEVAKLFARHFKLEEHVTYLKRTKIGVAVGTPGRLGKLLCETDAVNVAKVTHVILDVSYQDAKKRTLLDIPETRDEVFKTVLGAPKLLQSIKAGNVKVVLF